MKRREKRQLAIIGINSRFLLYRAPRAHTELATQHSHIKMSCEYCAATTSFRVKEQKNDDVVEIGLNNLNVNGWCAFH